MRIALISDIHGNLEALKAVLSDINKSKVDKIICLGDTLGKGVNPHECIKLIQENCSVVLMGNTDQRFCEDPEKYKENETEYSRIKFNQSLITEEDKKYLSSLPFSEEFFLSGHLVRLFHAHPTSISKFVNDYDISFKSKYAMFEGSELTQTKNIADIVIYGHLHYPFMQKLFNKTLVCAGSVGNSICLVQNDKLNSSPKEITQAHYVIIEGAYDSKVHSNVSFEFKSVCYDIKKELKSKKDNPEFEAYKVELTKGRYRDMTRVNKSFTDQGYEIEF